MNAYNDNKHYDWRELVETKNYQLTPVDESIINIHWENVRDQAPSKASIKLVLEKMDQNLAATWTVNNFDLSFEAEALGTDLRELLISMQKSLSGQMTEWKKSRFATATA